MHAMIVSMLIGFAPKGIGDNNQQATLTTNRYKVADTNTVDGE